MLGFRVAPADEQIFLSNTSALQDTGSVHMGGQAVNLEVGKKETSVSVFLNV